MFEHITVLDEVGQRLSTIPVDPLIKLAQTKGELRERANLEVFRRRLNYLTIMHMEVERGKKRAAYVASIKKLQGMKEGRLNSVKETVGA